jgi:hypothetical protein
LRRAPFARAEIHPVRKGIVKKLQLEEIQVDSYTTETVAQEKGTVQGNMATVLRCPTGPAVCTQDSLNYPSCVSAPYCC